MFSKIMGCVTVFASGDISPVRTLHKSMVVYGGQLWSLYDIRYVRGGLNSSMMNGMPMCSI